jgi:hypothetical protein
VTAWELTRHATPLGLVQLEAHASPPPGVRAEFEASLTSLTRTADELSIICAYEAMPGSVTGVARSPHSASTARWTIR